MGSSVSNKVRQQIFITFSKNCLDSYDAHLYVPAQPSSIPTANRRTHAIPARCFLSVCLVAVCASLAIAQSPQPSPSPQATDPQAAALLARSAAALRGNAPLSDVTLTGTARRIAGSDENPAK